MGNISNHLPIPKQVQFVLLFLIIFSVLHLAYSSTRGTAIEEILIDKITVATGTWIIDSISPALNVKAIGPKIRCAAGSLTVLNGCEGFEAIFLLVAAIVSISAKWRDKIVGVVLGTLFIYTLNQVRIVTLFYLFLQKDKWFNLVHGYIGPMIIIMLGSLFFFGWISFVSPKSSEAEINAES